MFEAILCILLFCLFWRLKRLALTRTSRELNLHPDGSGQLPFVDILQPPETRYYLVSDWLPSPESPQTMDTPPHSVLILSSPGQAGHSAKG